MCFLSVKISLVYLDIQSTLSIYYFDNPFIILITTQRVLRMTVEMALESLEMRKLTTRWMKSYTITNSDRWWSQILWSKFILRTFLRVPSVIQNFIFFILNQKFNFYDYVTDLMHVNTKSNAIHLKIVKSMILETAVV